MNIIYCHHAQRNRGTIPSQDDDITALGEQDAKLFAEMLKNEDDVKVSKIYTSPFFRCRKTAEIINSPDVPQQSRGGITIIENVRRIVFSGQRPLRGKINS